MAMGDGGSVVGINGKPLVYQPISDPWPLHVHRWEVMAVRTDITLDPALIDYLLSTTTISSWPIPEARLATVDPSPDTYPQAIEPNQL
jgi:hypothetical protein